MLDVVIQGVAVADALQREPRGERDDLGKARVREPESISDVVGQKRSEGFRRQAGHVIMDRADGRSDERGDPGPRFSSRVLRVQHAR